MGKYITSDLYAILRDNGINMPTEDVFYTNMSDPNYRKTLHKGLKDKGLDLEEDVKDFQVYWHNKFASDPNYKGKDEVTSKPVAQQPKQQSQPTQQSQPQRMLSGQRVPKQQHIERVETTRSATPKAVALYTPNTKSQIKTNEDVALESQPKPKIERPKANNAEQATKLKSSIETQQDEIKAKIEDAERRRMEAVREYNKKNRFLSAFVASAQQDAGVDPFASGAYGEEVTKITEEIQSLRNQLKRMTDAHDKIATALETKKGDGLFDLQNFKNIGRGIADTFTDSDFWDMGRGEFNANTQMMGISKKIQEGKELTDDELNVVSAELINQSVDQYIQSIGGLPIGYSVGQVTAEATRFMLEMGVNPARGASSAITRQLVKKLGVDGIKNAIAKKLATGAIKAVGNVAEAGTLVNTMQGMRTAGDAAKRYAGTIDINNDGNLIVVDNQGIGEAAYKAEASAIIQNVTELMGGGKLAELTNKGFNAAVKRLGDVISLGKISDFAGKMSATSFGRFVDGMAKRGAWQGFADEVFEEEYGIMLNSLLVGDSSFSDLVDPKQQAEIVLGCAFMDGSIKAIKIGGGAIEYRNISKKYRKAESKAKSLFTPEQWEMISSNLGGATDAEMGVMLATYLDPNTGLSPEQRQAVAEYAGSMVRYRGFNRMADNAKEESKQQSSVTTPTPAYEVDSDVSLIDDNGDTINGHITGVDEDGNYIVETNTLVNGMRVQPMSADQLDAMGNTNSGEIVDGVQTSTAEGYDITDFDQIGELSMLVDNSRDDVAQALGTTDVDTVLQQALGNNPTDSDIDAQFGDNAQVVKEYVHNRAKLNGSRQRNYDDLDIAIESIDSDIANIANTNGNVVTAKMVSEDGDVYVVDGNIVTYEDGQIDVANSDASVIIQKADGSREMVTPLQLQDIASTPTEQYRDELVQAFTGNHLQAYDDAVNGALDYSQGQQYAMLNADGSTTDVTILADNGDGNVTVTARDGNKEGGVTDGKQIVLPKSQIQQGVREFKRNQLRQAKVQQVEQTEQHQQVTDTQTPSATKNIAPRDEQGNVLYGQMSADNAWDMLVEESGGDVDIAMMVAQSNIEDAQKALDKAKKQTPKLVGTTEEKLATAKAFKEAVVKAQNDLAKWQEIADVPKRRASLQTEQTDLQTELQTEPQGQQVAGKLPASEEAVNSIDDLQWSEELADNGEPFFIGENGSIDLVNIPQEVFDAIGINKSPFRLTPSMVMHVYMRHKKELKLMSLKDAVDVILDVMRNFDHVRQGKDATYIFSIENNRNKSARRAVTFVLEYDNGEWIGIKTLGYDRISNLKNMTTLWAKGENNFATGVTTANVSSTQSLQGDQKGGIASNQRADVSTDKGSNLSSNNKENSEKVEEEKTKKEADKKVKQLAKTFAGTYQQLGEPMTFEEFVLRELSSGKIKFIWGDNTNNTKGLNSHLGYHSEAERKQRLWMLDNQRGERPEVVAQGLLEDARAQYNLGHNIDDMDALNVLLAIVATYPTARSMFDEVVAIHKSAEEAEEKYYQELEEQDIYNTYHMSIEEYRDYCDVVEEEIKQKHLSDKEHDEYNNIYVESALNEQKAINNEDNQRNDQRRADGIRTSSNGVLQEEQSTQPRGDQHISENGRSEADDNSNSENAVAPEGEQVGYSITPTTYVTKANKVLDMHLLVFDRPLGKEEHKSAREIAKSLRGWYDAKEGGYMMRSEEDAKSLANAMLDKEVVESTQPVSLSDVNDFIAEEPKKESKPTEAKPSNPSGNKLVTDERYAELRERMRKKLGGQMNMGIDPEILAIGTEMAVYHIEKGARKFKDYATDMIADLGDAIRPYLKAFYNGARELPEVEDAGFVNEMTPYEEVKSFDVANFDKTVSNPLDTADAIAKEAEVEKQAEEATEKIKDARNDKRIEFINNLHSGDRVILKDGRNVLISVVMHRGEQVLVNNAFGYTKPTAERFYATYKGESIDFTPDKIDVDATLKFREDLTSKTSESTEKSVPLQEQTNEDQKLLKSEENGLQRNDVVRTEGLQTDNNKLSSKRSRRSNNSEVQQDGGRIDRSRESGNERVGDEISQSDGRSVGRLSGITDKKNTRNNHSERGKDHAPTSVDARIEANIKAIELAKQLLENEEQATEKQMQTLRKFSGWGGLGKAFSEGNYYAPNPISVRLRELLGEEAYQQAVMSANSAYYTPAYVVDTLWDIAEQLGFKGGNILEGSAGIGNILGQMPTHISERSDIHAIEIDGTSGGILSLLYPDANVEIQGFEQTRIPNGSVDLAITNVPFVTGLRVKDTTGDKDLSKKFHNIHDFCIAKNVRKLREGGLGIFITSNGTLDNSKKLRDWIVSEGNSDFIGAFRLNNKTFGGTGVTSDIIVIRKRINGQKSANAIDVSTISGERTAEYNTGETRKVKGIATPIVKELSMDYNKYFIEHPENMAGEMYFAFEKGDTFRPTSKGLYPKPGKEQEQMLTNFVKSLKEDEFVERVDTDTKVADVNPDKKIGELFEKDGKLYINNSASAQLLDVNNNKVKGHTKVECLKAYDNIKKALEDVMSYQVEHEDNKELKPLLDKLNKAYDDFVGTYGHFNKNTAIAFLRNDVDYANVASIETYKELGDGKGGITQKFGKADVMSGRVIEKTKEPSPANVKDGIIASVFKFGRIDVPYISEQLGRNAEEIKKEIIESGYGFENPTTRQMEVSYQYLSGNVREKLRSRTKGDGMANINGKNGVAPEQRNRAKSVFDWANEA